MPIWLENVLEHESVFSRPDEFELVLGRAPGVAMVYDIGHANLGIEMPERLIAPLADRIAAISLSDNNGDHDAHAGLGQGSINWRSS